MAVAYQLTPQISIGAGLDLNWQVFDLRLPLGVAYLDLGQCTGTGFSAALGILYKPIKSLSFGFSWNSRTVMSDLKSDSQAGYVKMVGNREFPNLDVTVKDFDFPHIFTWGIAYQPIEKIRLSAELKYILWSDTFKVMKVRYSGPGASALPVTKLDVPMNIKDQTPVGVGIEYFATPNLTLSFGYRYGDNAVPDNNLLPQAPAIVQHSWVFGIVYQLRELNVAFAYIHSEGEDLKASSIHAIDAEVSPQLGLRVGGLNSELSNSELVLNTNTFFITVAIPF